MKRIVLVLLSGLIFGCGNGGSNAESSTPADTVSRLSAPSDPVKISTVTVPGVMLTLSGSELKAIDFTVKGIIPSHIENKLVTISNDCNMCLAAATSEGWVRVICIDINPLDGKYIWIPSQQTGQINVVIKESIDSDYKPTFANVNVALVQ